jgi:predicted dehydrogenase
MDTVRLGIVGLGFGQRHVETAGGLEGVRVAAVADNRPVGGKTPVADYARGIGAAGYDDGARMIAEADLDAVDLVVAPKFREPLLEAAAKRRLPVLMEKPMAVSVAQAERFARIVADAGIPLMIEYPMRFYPAIRRARELLYDGPLGKPWNVEGSLQTFWNPPAGHWTWDADNAGGLINECGCHLLDTLCFLCGSPSSVYAIGGNVMQLGGQPDTAAMVLRFDSGCTGVANVGGLGTWAMGVPMQVRIFAENGEVRVRGNDWTCDTVDWSLRGWDAKLKTETHPAPPREELLRCNMAEFLRVVREGIEPPCGLADGLRVQRLIAAVVESIRTGRQANVQADGCAWENRP